jgi:DNA-3-methyladenine glycosylase II
MGWLNEDAALEVPNGRTDVGAYADFGDRLESAVAAVRGADPVLDELMDRHGPCTLKPSRPQFPVIVETVISQQLSTRAARAIYRRLVGFVGRRAPRAADIINTPDEALLSIGFSRSKTLYLKNAARAFRSRKYAPGALGRLPDDEVMSLLTEIKGIGEWSAHMFLIFALGRLDVFPVGDLGLRNAMSAAYRLRRPPSSRRLHQIADLWRPYRTIGTWYLWESYDNG